MRRFLKWGSLCLLTALGVGGARAQVDQEVFLGLTASLLKVEAVGDDGSVSLGTGIAVGRGIVATNCHVTRAARAIELVRGARRIAVDSQYGEVERDLCLLHAAGVEDVAPVAVSPAALTVGQPVLAIGFAYGRAPQLGHGEVQALHDYDGAQVVEHSAPFNAGASGGGLFDARGRLVGIVSFRSRSAPFRHYALPVAWLHQALLRDAATPVRPLAGQPFWQRRPEGQPYFLRAASLEADENWSEMAYVAQRWSAAESFNPQSWLALGKARYHLSESRSAIEALLLRAAQLAPTLAAAWCQLGLAYTATAENGAAGQAREMLQRLTTPSAGCPSP
ncbi:MAG: trypsin-like peptidase domain-containing protein [Rhodocyclales bacterium]|nr:trypsin-like peptidase domain-containing protein [Rhodocyclales bacterium]